MSQEDVPAAGLPLNPEIYRALVEDDCKGRLEEAPAAALRAQGVAGLRMWQSTLQKLITDTEVQLGEGSELRSQLFKANPTVWSESLAQYKQWRESARHFTRHVEQRLIEVELLITRALQLADPYELLATAASRMVDDSEWHAAYEDLLAHREGELAAEARLQGEKPRARGLKRRS